MDLGPWNRANSKGAANPKMICESPRFHPVRRPGESVTVASGSSILRVLLLAIAWPWAVHAQGAQSSAPAPSVPPVPVVAPDSPRAAFSCIS